MSSRELEGVADTPDHMLPLRETQTTLEKAGYKKSHEVQERETHQYTLVADKLENSLA